jgi:alkylhydroperoxidase/carboxymuconolactone decarboxylase family protein YurZ
VTEEEIEMNPLQIIQEMDPELIKLIETAQDLELSDGALPKKYKLLMAMAIEASRWSLDGVSALIRESMEAGATRDEISETIRVVHFCRGKGTVHIFAQALREVA